MLAFTSIFVNTEVLNINECFKDACLLHHCYRKACSLGVWRTRKTVAFPLLSPSSPSHFHTFLFLFSCFLHWAVPVQWHFLSNSALIYATQVKSSAHYKPRQLCFSHRSFAWLDRVSLTHVAHLGSYRAPSTWWQPV